MEDSILQFAKQFEFEPEINNSEKILEKESPKHFIIAGMGGSHLAAGLIQTLRPEIELYIHKDYGLPQYTDEFLEESLLIASSYSGNTEEILDFADEAYSRGLNLLIITTGGKLAEFAKENEIPHILMPDTGIQPRTALGFSILSMLKAIDSNLFNELKEFGIQLEPESLRESAEELAKNIENSIPIIYTSRGNRHIGYNWKIKMNETGKIPAFQNIFPELNHNEMQGYDFNENSKELSEKIHFVLLHDSSDDIKIEKRMNTFEQVLEKKGFSVTSIYLEGDSQIEKIFNSLLMADWLAYTIATKNEAEPESVNLIEEFKSILKK